MGNPFDPGYYGTDELRDMGFKSVGDEVFVARNSTIIGLHNIELADHARIDGFCTIIASGGALKLGRYVHIHTSVVIGCRGGVQIGDFSGISHGCHILSASDDFSGKWMTNSTLPPHCVQPTIAPIKVGAHVPIGAGCSIFPGVTIGDGAAVMAHSCVSSDLSEWMMCSGSPARAKVPRARGVVALGDALSAVNAAA